MALIFGTWSNRIRIAIANSSSSSLTGGGGGSSSLLISSSSSRSSALPVLISSSSSRSSSSGAATVTITIPNGANTASYNGIEVVGYPGTKLTIPNLSNYDGTPENSLIYVQGAQVASITWNSPYGGKQFTIELPAAYWPLLTTRIFTGVIATNDINF